MTTLFVGLHLAKKVENEFYAVQQVFFQSVAFLDAEAVNDVEGLVEGLVYFFDESLVVILGGDIEDADSSSSEVILDGMGPIDDGRQDLSSSSMSSSSNGKMSSSLEPTSGISSSSEPPRPMSSSDEVITSGIQFVDCGTAVQRLD